MVELDEDEVTKRPVTGTELDMHKMGGDDRVWLVGGLFDIRVSRLGHCMGSTADCKP